MGLSNIEASALYENFLSLQLKAEIKLLNGNCTTGEVADMMDFLQWGKIAVATRSYYEDSDRISAQKILIESSDALNQVMIRGIDSEHYVCTGDEINLIRDGMAIVEGEGFDGQGQLAWDRTIGALYDYEEK